MCNQVSWYYLPALIAVTESSGLFFKFATVLQSPPPCWSPQEFIVTKCALNVLNELICPHHLSQRCWMTGTPPGTLPTQTYSCSPTPAAAFALCKPLLCPQSVRWTKRCFKQPHTFCLSFWQYYKDIKTVSNKKKISSSFWNAKCQKQKTCVLYSWILLMPFNYLEIKYCQDSIAKANSRIEKCSSGFLTVSGSQLNSKRSQLPDLYWIEHKVVLISSSSSLHESALR